MGSLFTLEDVNTTIYNYGRRAVYEEINTADIGTGEFTDVKYDFCTVSKSFNEGAGATFTFKVENIYWNGRFYILKQNHDILSTGTTSSFDAETNTITIITTNETNIIIGLVISPFVEFMFAKFYLKLVGSNIIPIYLNEIGTRKTITVYDIRDKSEHNMYVEVTGNPISLQGGALIYTPLIRTDFQFNCQTTAIIGGVTKIPLGTAEGYKPSGALIGEHSPTITVNFEGETIPVSFDSGLEDFCFELDLSEKTEKRKISFTVNVEANAVLNETSTKVSLNTDYYNITTENELSNAISDENIHIFQLGADITTSNTLYAASDLKIIGNNHILDFDEEGCFILYDCNLSIENLKIINGNTTIRQRDNSKVNLLNVTFENCCSSNYNNLGSCIFCENDVENLEIENDFETILDNCNFKNNTSCIFHGGELIVNNCRLHNTDLSYADKDNVAFLYQTDGNAIIKGSIFDLDYTENTLCANQSNIGLAQALVLCGETAIINNADYEMLRDDNSLPFFDVPFTNQTHLFAKYYYPQIETCVYSSPVPNREDKNCCHAVTDLDWVFKNNTQITRADSDAENEIRKIVWED